MPAARHWMGSLLLGLPEPLRSLRKVPILGNLAHYLSHRIVPPDEKVWVRVEGGPGRVFSFEPDPEVAGRPRRNVSRNGFANVTVVEAGVWSSSGDVNFVVADPSSPDRGVGRFVAGGGRAAGTPVRCVALDDFARSVPPPDAIKCDVEGAEIEVFRGAEQLRTARRPWILCEMHSEANEKFLRAWLGGLGYRLESVDGLHILATSETVGP